MYKIILTFLWCVFLLTAQPVRANSEGDFTQVIKENSDAVIAISLIPRQLGYQAPSLVDMTSSQSLGSGFVISEDGYILTNYHVLRETDMIIVKFRNGHVLEGTLIGFDRVTDLALLKVNAHGLQTVKIGSIADLEVGEWVLAIGSPFGFEQSVTKGIISAKNRMVSKEIYVPFLQTDVAINQGNSGGPLFNMRGQVVGVNAWIYSKTGDYAGLSFAIPIDIAMEVAKQLKNQGKVSRGWLGVMSTDVNDALAQSFAMPRAYGALITKIAYPSPAQQAGLMIGDIVVSINGVSIENSADLPRKIGMIMPGQVITLEFIRQGEPKRVQVTVATPHGN